MLQRIIKCPPDKSLSHRALLLALHAKGTSKIQNLSMGLDVAATRSIVGQFANINITHSELKQDEVDDKISMNVEITLNPNWEAFFLDNAPRKDSEELFKFDCKNSGTTARLVVGMFSAKGGFNFLVDGDESLRRRPMKRLIDALNVLGLSREDVEFLEEKSGKDLPLKVKGKKFKGGHVVLKTSSAQLKSACLLAALSIEDLKKYPITIELPSGSRDHTEIMLNHLGVALEKKLREGKEILRLEKSPSTWGAFSCRIPRDPSAAAFWALVAFLKQEKIVLPEIALNPTRIQWVDVLANLGFEFEIKVSKLGHNPQYFGERVGDIVITPPTSMDASLHVFSEQVAQMIDELPLLATISCFNQKQSVFENVDELLFKESNRLQAIQDLLALLGRKSEVFKNEDQKTCLKVLATTNPQVNLGQENPSIDARSDHRIAMIATILKILKFPDLKIRHGDEEVIAVSDPGFLLQLRQSLHDKDSSELYI